MRAFKNVLEEEMNSKFRSLRNSKYKKFSGWIFESGFSGWDFRDLNFRDGIFREARDYFREKDDELQ